MPNTFVKEKQFFIYHIEGKKSDYKIDFANGVVYGLRGKPISTPPPHLTWEFMRKQVDQRTNLIATLTDLMHWRSFDEIIHSEKYRLTLSLMDKIDMLYQSNGYRPIPIIESRGSSFRYLSDVEWFHDNFKIFSKYLLEIEPVNLTYTKVFSSFQKKVEDERLKKKFNIVIDDHYFTEYMWEDFKGFVHKFNDFTPTDEEVRTALYYYTHTAYNFCHEVLGAGLNQVLRRHFWHCRELGIPAQKTDFFRHAVEVKRNYDLLEEKIKSEKMGAIQSKIKSLLEFEANGYMITVPTTAQELVDEGNALKHCVGGYADSIIDGKCFIVFVRDKNNPEKPYITCEIYRGKRSSWYGMPGNIGQYHKKNNVSELTFEEQAFYDLYQAHIKEVWGKVEEILS